MSSDIYHQGIKHLAASEQGAGSLDAPDASVSVDNPLCGDRLTLQLKLQGNTIVAIAHQVRGCMLCHAAASVLGAVAVGCDIGELEAVQQQLSDKLKGASDSPWPKMWESLTLFRPVQAHKSRHNCVLLPFKALSMAVSTALSMELSMALSMEPTKTGSESTRNELTSQA